MSRVCGDKQSVAERASAHRIRVRDLAAIRLLRACICAPFAANETRSRAHPRNPRTARDSDWDHRFFGIGDRGHIAAAAAAAAAVWPQYRFGTAGIYRTLLRRLGDHCENYGVIIACERSMRFAIAIDDKRWSVNFGSIANKYTRTSNALEWRFKIYINLQIQIWWKILLEIEQRIFFF